MTNRPFGFSQRLFLVLRLDVLQRTLQTRQGRVRAVHRLTVVRVALMPREPRLSNLPRDVGFPAPRRANKISNIATDAATIAAVTTTRTLLPSRCSTHTPRVRLPVFVAGFQRVDDKQYYGSAVP